MTTDPTKIAAPGDAHAPVERPTTGDATPSARPRRGASPVVTFRPSASPVAQMVQCQDERWLEYDDPIDVHQYWLRMADDYRHLAEIAGRRGHPWHAERWTARANEAAARAFTFAAQVERAEKAGGL